MQPIDKKAEKEQRKALADAERAVAAEAQRLQTLENSFWSAPYGQARAAKLAGDKYFQIEIALDSTTQDVMHSMNTIATKSQKYTGHGRRIGEIEAEGWELVHAGFVFKETGQVSRDKFLSSGQMVNTTGMTVGVYLFKATDAPPRTDEVWRTWAAQQEG